jgi:single-strand DNA-binding protein
MNKVILKGRLTATPELKQTPNGVYVTDFSVAVNRRFNKEQTDFINCQAWRTTAEFINKYFDKGQEILLFGELHIEKYEKEGETKYATRVVIDEVEFCGSKADNKAQEDADDANVENMPVAPQEDTDDLPF